MKRKYNVCAVGTRGIGKTITTPLLIKMLLQRGHTVVYLQRTNKEFGWYVEFVPTVRSCEIKVYPENTQIRAIPSLNLWSTFYIVDPGKTIDSCDVAEKFVPRTIIVSSPDFRHWGGSTFMKPFGNLGSTVSGTFRFYPLWTLRELIACRGVFDKDISETMVIDRYRQFGGVPSQIFVPEDDMVDFAREQKCAIHSMTFEETKRIALGTGSYDQPNNAVVSLESFNNFRVYEAAIISSAVSESLFSRYTFMEQLWKPMLDSDKFGWKILEAHCRLLMVNETKRSFFARSCVRKIDESKDSSLSSMHLGGCHSIKLALNIVEASKLTRSVVFHSTEQMFSLIDFIYHDTDGSFHAFRVTTGCRRSACVDEIRQLKTAIGDAVLYFYILLPGERFVDFETDLVEPTVVGCQVFHVLIPNPGMDSKQIERIIKEHR